MTDQPPKKDPDQLLSSSLHSAIWQFVITLIQQYRKTLSPADSARAVSSWLRELADKIDEQANASQSEAVIINDLLDTTGSDIT